MYFMTCGIWQRHELMQGLTEQTLEREGVSMRWSQMWSQRSGRPSVNIWYPSFTVGHMLVKYFVEIMGQTKDGRMARQMRQDAYLLSAKLPLHHRWSWKQSKKDVVSKCSKHEYSEVKERSVKSFGKEVSTKRLLSLRKQNWISFAHHKERLLDRNKMIRRLTDSSTCPETLRRKRKTKTKMEEISGTIQKSGALMNCTVVSRFDTPLRSTGHYFNRRLNIFRLSHGLRHGANASSESIAGVSSSCSNVSMWSVFTLTFRWLLLRSLPSAVTIISISLSRWGSQWTILKHASPTEHFQDISFPRLILRVRNTTNSFWSDQVVHRLQSQPLTSWVPHFQSTSSLEDETKFIHSLTTCHRVVPRTTFPSGRTVLARAVLARVSRFVVLLRSKDHENIGFSETTHCLSCMCFCCMCIILMQFPTQALISLLPSNSVLVSLYFCTPRSNHHCPNCWEKKR